jgi:hypothetical protein
MPDRSRWNWLAAAFLLTWSPAAVAQTAATPIASDSFLALVPPRAPAEISQEIEAAQQAYGSADQAEKSALALRSGADARIQAKKQMISTTDARKKLAQREKREAEVTALEAEKQALELEKNLLERRKSLREAEIDVARQTRELAALRRKALELEQQLMLKRAEHSGAQGAGPAAARANQILLDLERATLEAQKKRVEKEKDVVEREKRVIERRIAILGAQRNLISGR